MVRVLIVEDSPTQAERLKLVLETEGMEAVVANDAEAALAQLPDSGYDIVISDIVMPGLSGYDLCRRIKADRRWRDIPVILLTSLKDPLDIIRGLECGADNFVTKPFEPDRLIERVRHILENRRLRAQGKVRMGIEVSFLGRTFAITSEREQILDLLISTFEDIVRTNEQLEQSRRELESAKTEIERYARRMEGEARSSEEKYRVLVENVGDAIFTVDEAGRITSFNSMAQQVFGYAADEIVGASVDLLTVAPEEDRPSRLIEDYVRTGVSRFVGIGAREVEGRRKDGSTFPLEVVVSETAVEGGRMFIAAARDLTERKHTEAQLRQAQKMDAVGQLTGGIAHDFNNLLTVVLGNLELLERAYGGDERLLQRLRLTSRAAQRGAELTRRLLAFSRRQVLEPKVCDFNEVVAGMSQLLGRTLGESIEIRTAFADDLWPTRVDVGQLETALLNLAINSRDAMPGGGRLTIETANAQLDQSYVANHADVQAGDYVMIAVSDTGTGIPREMIERVFEPFFTTKEVGRGTGLGLSMVYGFVKQSGGHVNAYSELGHGTTIKIYLPRTAREEPQAHEEAEPAAGDAPAQERLTVLLVEDDPDVRQTGIALLEELGHRVTTAENGQAALATLEERDDIDLLFTDIVMPGGMSGRELAEIARARRPGLKVLYCSGYTQRSILFGGGLGEGAVLVAKPYSRRDLVLKIRQALNG